MKGSDLVGEHERSLQQLFPLEAPSLLSYVEHLGLSSRRVNVASFEWHGFGKNPPSGCKSKSVRTRLVTK